MKTIGSASNQEEIGQYWIERYCIYLKNIERYSCSSIEEYASLESALEEWRSVCVGSGSEHDRRVVRIKNDKEYACYRLHVQRNRDGVCDFSHRLLINLKEHFDQTHIVAAMLGNKIMRLQKAGVLSINDIEALINIPEDPHSWVMLPHPP